MVQMRAKWLVLLAGLGFFIGECPRLFARNDDPGLLNQLSTKRGFSRVQTLSRQRKILYVSRPMLVSARCKPLRKRLAGANTECGHKSALQLLPDAHYESIGLSRLSNTICVGDDFHVAFWHITPGHLLNVVDSVEACGVGRHVAMPLGTVRSAEN
jgi:hypothetical protein